VVPLGACASTSHQISSTHKVSTSRQVSSVPTRAELKQVFEQSNALDAHAGALSTIDMRDPNGLDYDARFAHVQKEASGDQDELRALERATPDPRTRRLFRLMILSEASVGATTAALRADLNHSEWPIQAFCADPALRRSSQAFRQLRSALIGFEHQLGFDTTGESRRSARDALILLLRADMACQRAIDGAASGFTTQPHTAQSTRAAFRRWISTYGALRGRVQADKPTSTDPAVRRLWATISRSVASGISFYEADRAYSGHPTARGRASALSLLDEYQADLRDVDAALSAVRRLAQ
jgi:hypothetical protein